MTLRQALSGEERLWKVWWLWGIPTALAASALTECAELLRDEGHHASGTFFDVLKVLVYAAWFIAAWRCAGNTEHAAARSASRLAAACGLVLVALTA